MVVLCATGFWVATIQGIGLSPDTVAYFGMARDPLQGVGGFPPGYSLILALFNIPFADLTVAARWANTALLIVTLLLIYTVTRRATGSRFAGSIAALLVGSSPKVLGVFGGAISESAFLVWTLLTLLALAWYVESPARSAALMVAGLASGMALLTRFAGAPLVAVCWTVVWLYGPRPALQKLRQGVLATLLACLPLGLWIYYGRFVLNRGAEQSTGRELAMLGNADLSTFKQGVAELGNLFLPTAIPASIRTAVLILIVIGSALLLRRYTTLMANASQRSKRLLPLSRFPMIAALFICWYTAFLIVSVFIEANLPLTMRYMVPIYTVFIPMVTIAGFHILREAIRPEQLTRVAVMLALVLAVSMLPRGVHWGVDRFQKGAAGYASTQWRSSELIARVRLIKSGVPIYTNGPDAIILLTGRKARRIPNKIFRRSGLPNTAYRSEMETMERDLRKHHGVLVYFRTITWRFYLPDEGELQAQINLRPLHTLTDGVIYHVPIEH